MSFPAVAASTPPPPPPGGGGRKRPAPASRVDRTRGAKKVKKAKLPRGVVRSGARCVDCADQNHTCVPAPRAAAAAIRAAINAAAAADDDDDDSVAAAAAAATEAQRVLRAHGVAAAVSASFPSARAAPAVGAAPDWVVAGLEIGGRIADALEGILRCYADSLASEEVVEEGEEEEEEE
ncbi:hypothetical protein TruAng_005992 [Truncatella angustata]|nr:hypothetical protein TruAng_005992 [Truncatella angustata]